MPDLTRALVQRHALGRADAYDAALLDIAQDHLLYLLAEVGFFEDDRLVFKGGTSLRKCRLGNDGRFSTDLDFAAPDEDVVLNTCGHIDGARVGGFAFVGAGLGRVAGPMQKQLGVCGRDEVVQRHHALDARWQQVGLRGVEQARCQLAHPAGDARRRLRVGHAAHAPVGPAHRVALGRERRVLAVARHEEGRPVGRGQPGQCLDHVAHGMVVFKGRCIEENGGVHPTRATGRGSVPDGQPPHLLRKALLELVNLSIAGDERHIQHACCGVDELIGGITVESLALQ